MTTPRGFRDRADDSLLTLLGDVPELVRNLVIAEVDAAKAWLARTAKDAGIGSGWIVGALFVLFWSIPVLGTFIIAGLSSWWVGGVAVGARRLRRDDPRHRGARPARRACASARSPKPRTRSNRSPRM